MATAKITSDSIVSRNEDVLYSEVADGMSLMDIESGRYFHFESTGAQIWLKLDSQTPVAKLCASLQEEFEVGADQCRKDTIEFLSELYALNLVEVC